MSALEEPVGTTKKTSESDPLLPAVESVARPTPVASAPHAVDIDFDHPLLVGASNYSLPLAEEYRKLKATIVRLSKREGFQNTIMVTSSLEGEGKSTTALNLAISLAQEHDHYVLLIDADLRRPSLSKYLGLEPELGLVDCLRDGVDVGKALIKTGLGNLSFLPAGKPVVNPVELFSSQKMQELLHEVKNRYSDRYIVIDTTSVLPFAEASLIGNIVDGVVFVVKQGKTSMSNVGEAVEALKETNLFGIVYNSVTSAGLDGAYHYYYDDNYYYKERPSLPSPGGKRGFISKLLGK
jgi:exopolysaccharide/PEP-CTERM locus tyrosine autokinase